ncbi:MAG: tRNA (adenosine(37)-N6)-threonylcarbamoyltransferase complex ATPase subunit type 1 TsaE [Candidatus Magasanikbacteria bacterium]|nr:tRNA (adenosine(37)-N6)-threonylcarbamoyltransferase complex ATPase subunit type 1 TsaE [Candidatus Magasanikbacteria bacterium]
MTIHSPLLKITSHSEDETKKTAAALAKTLAGGMVVCLHGELGAGKTTFVKGLAGGLGITENITSPTFTLMNVYKIQPTHPYSIPPPAASGIRDLSKSGQAGILTLVHIDTYRLKNEQELVAIGVEDYLGEFGVVTVIEWPEKIAGLLKGKKVTNVTIDHRGETSRSIVID